MAADQQRAAETLTMELDRLDKEWASKAALRVRGLVECVDPFLESRMALRPSIRAGVSLEADIIFPLAINPFKACNDVNPFAHLKPSMAVAPTCHQVKEAMADREAQFRADMAALRESLSGATAEAQAQLEARLREELAAAIAKADQEAAAARAKHAEVRIPRWRGIIISNTAFAWMSRQYC